jgi:hypothetical protein
MTVPETPTPDSQTPVQSPASAPTGTATPAADPTGRQILRMGLWNYVMHRWGPQNGAARFGMEMGILLAFFLVLAILAKLAAG